MGPKPQPAIVLAIGFCAFLNFSGPGAAVARDVGERMSPAVGSFETHRFQSEMKSLEGTWELVSFYEEDEYGEESEVFGLAPSGRLTFDREGHFEFAILDDLGFKRCVTFSGTYSLTTHRTIRFSLTHAPSPGSPKVEHQSDLDVTDNRLELTSAGFLSLTRAAFSHTVWRRRHVGERADKPLCVQASVERTGK